MPQLLPYLFILTAVAQPPPDLVTIRGRVTNPVTGQPRPGVEMKLEDDNWHAVTFPVRTNAAGLFAFPPVKRETWMLSAENPEIGNVVYGADAPGNGNAFVVYPPNKETFLEFPITPRGSLRGKVETSGGTPLEHVAVEFRRPSFKDDRIVLHVARVARTNIFGEFYFGALPPSEYVLCAVPNVLDRIVPPVGFLDLAVPASYRIYTESCLPPQRITSNSSRSINFKLSPSSSLTLSGRVTGFPPFDPKSPNGPQNEVELKSLSFESSGRSPFQGGLNTKTMEFLYEGLEPGSYSLRITNISNNRGVVRVEMLNLKASIAGLVLDLKPPSPLRFTLTSDGDADLTPNLESLQLVSAAGYFTRPVKNLFDPGIIEGDYRLRAEMKEGACIAAATMNGESVLRKRFHIEGGKEQIITISLTKKCGSFTGRVVRDGRPVPRARVVALLSGTPQEPNDLLSLLVDSDGDFNVSGLTPGIYQFAAWQEDGAEAHIPFSLADADFIAATVAPSESRTIEIPLSKGKL